MSIIYSTHRCVTENAPNIDDFTYDWVVTGATIVGSDGPKIQVSTDSETTSHFTLECTVTSTTVDPDNADAIGSATYSIEASHERTVFTTEIGIIRNGSCSYAPPETSCVSTGEFKVTSGQDLSGAVYSWNVVGNNVTIVGSKNFSTLSVLVDNELDFTVECTTTLNGIASVSTLTTSHSRFEDDPSVNVTDIVELTSGVCVFDGENNGTCVATSSYSAVVNSTISTYTWTVSGATITGPGNQNEVTVTTDGNEVVDSFTLTCEVVDVNGFTGERSETFSHTRYDSTHAVVVINGADTLNGSYIYPDEVGTIYSTYSHTIYNMENPDVLWTIESGAALISGSATSPTVNVIVVDNQSGSFVLKSVATDVNGTAQNSKTVNYTITDNTTAPAIGSIFSNGGGCSIGEGETTCVATSDHTVIIDEETGAGELSYEWAVAGASLIAGQGTETITVETDSSEKDVYFTVTCTVTDELHETDTFAQADSHERLGTDGLNYIFAADSVWVVTDEPDSDDAFYAAAQTVTTFDGKTFIFLEHKNVSAIGTQLVAPIIVWLWNAAEEVFQHYGTIDPWGLDLNDVATGSNYIAKSPATNKTTGQLAFLTSVDSSSGAKDGRIDTYEWDGSNWVFLENVKTFDNAGEQCSSFTTSDGYTDMAVQDEGWIQSAENSGVWVENNGTLTAFEATKAFNQVNITPTQAPSVLYNLRSMFTRNAPGAGWTFIDVEDAQTATYPVMTNDGLAIVNGRRFFVRDSIDDQFDYDNYTDIGDPLDETYIGGAFDPNNNNKLILFRRYDISWWENFGTYYSPNWKLLRETQNLSGGGSGLSMDTLTLIITDNNLMVRALYGSRNGLAQIDWED